MRIMCAVGAALALTAGCGAVDDRAEAAAGTATQLLTSVQRRDGAAACALLAPDTAKEVGDRCAEAILDEDLPAPGPVRAAHVYGQWAQVRLGDDTVFLAVFPGGWRVVAAGCTPRGDRPYDCVLQGG